MKAEEALKRLKELTLADAELKDDGYDIQVLEFAVESVKKQIPKEPTFDGDGYAPDGTFVWDEWLCPHCGTRYEVDYDQYDFCPNCGQSIDWVESE